MVTGSGGAKTRVQTCAKCRNHDRVSMLKGHKRFCLYKNCRCRKCELTIQRRRVMSEQIKLRRYQAQDVQNGISTLKTEEEYRNESPSTAPSIRSSVPSQHLTSDPVNREMGALNVAPSLPFSFGGSGGYTGLTDISRARTLPTFSPPLQKESTHFPYFSSFPHQDQTQETERNLFIDAFRNNTVPGGMTGGLTGLVDGPVTGRLLSSSSGESSPTSSLYNSD